MFTAVAIAAVDVVAVVVVVVALVVVVAVDVVAVAVAVAVVVVAVVELQTTNQKGNHELKPIRHNGENDSNPFLLFQDPANQPLIKKELLL